MNRLHINHALVFVLLSVGATVLMIFTYLYENLPDSRYGHGAPFR